MYTSGILSALQANEQYSVSPRGHEKATETAEIGNRNTGPDTVSLSNEALEKYSAMANGSSTAQDDGEAAGSSTLADFLEKQELSQKQKMEFSDILAWMKSDNFAKEAMGYAKAAIASEFSTTQETEAADLINTLGSNDGENRSVAESSESRDVAENGNSANTSSNGKNDLQKDLAEEIKRVEEEVKELTEAYELIMGGEGELDDKLRLSQPVHKRLQDRLEELHSLKAQAQNLADEKHLMKSA